MIIKGVLRKLEASAADVRLLRMTAHWVRHAVSWVTWIARSAVSELSFRRRSTETKDNECPPMQNVFPLESLQVSIINLDRRPDRLRTVSENLISVGLGNYTRFPAVEDEIPLAGCAKSHGTLISTSATRTRPLMICEDDVQILADETSLKTLLSEFLRDPKLDVLCLGNVLSTPVFAYSSLFSRTNDVQTTSCYVVKPRAFDSISRVFMRSAELLAKGASPKRAALDILWKRLQVKDFVFVVPNEKVVVQMPGWSDIQSAVVDYSSAEIRSLEIVAGRSIRGLKIY